MDDFVYNVGDCLRWSRTTNFTVYKILQINPCGHKPTYTVKNLNTNSTYKVLKSSIENSFLYTKLNEIEKLLYA